MEITQLRYFLTAAETLNYSRAAEKLYISRQALRQAIAAMEKEIGTPLFSNQRNKLSLTLAGEYLQKTGKDVLASFDRMMEGLEGLSTRRSGLRIGVSGSLVTFMYPEVAGTLEDFQRTYPDIPMEWKLWNNDQVILGVARGDLDCGLAIWIPGKEGTSGEPVYGNSAYENLLHEDSLHREQPSGEALHERSLSREQPAGETLPETTLHRELLSEYGVIVSYGENHPLTGRERIGIGELLPYHCMGVGSLETTLWPVAQECRSRGLCLDYEIVPNTFDVFYRIEHEDSVVFDFLMEMAPEYARTNHSRLADYRWEMGWLYRGSDEKEAELGAFRQFMHSEYTKNRQRPRVYR